MYEYFYTNIIKYFDEKDYKSHHMEFITYDRYIDMVFTYILPRMNYIQRHNFFKYTYTDKEQIKKALKLKSDVMKEDIKNY